MLKMVSTHYASIDSMTTTYSARVDKGLDYYHLLGHDGPGATSAPWLLLCSFVTPTLAPVAQVVGPIPYILRHTSNNLVEKGTVRR